MQLRKYDVELCFLTSYNIPAFIDLHGEKCYANIGYTQFNYNINIKKDLTYIQTYVWAHTHMYVYIHC